MMATMHIERLNNDNEIFAISDDVRYVAIHRDGKLETKSKSDTQRASSSESDRYEELLVKGL